MELYCIHCENLTQLGVDVRTTHVQPTTWKGHGISVCKSEECKDYKNQI